MLLNRSTLLKKLRQIVRTDKRNGGRSKGRTTRTTIKKTRPKARTRVSDKQVLFDGHNITKALELNKYLNTVYEELVVSGGVLKVKIANYYDNGRGCNFSYTPVKAGTIIKIKDKHIYLKELK